MLHAPLCREYSGISVELEPIFWSALDQIAAVERTSLQVICRDLVARLIERQQRKGDVADMRAALVTALRVLALSYFQQAARQPAFALRLVG